MSSGGDSASGLPSNTPASAAWIDEALVGGLEIRSCGLGGQQLALCADRFPAYSGLQRFGSQHDYLPSTERGESGLGRLVHSRFDGFRAGFDGFHVGCLLPLNRRAHRRSGWYRHVALLECNVTLDRLRLSCHPYCHNLTLNTVCRPLVILVHAECLNIPSENDFRLCESKRCFNFVPNRRALRFCLGLACFDDLVAFSAIFKSFQRCAQV